MTPAPWAFVVLALGAYRVLRLLAWDEFPPVAALRARLLGEEWIRPVAPPDVAQAGRTSEAAVEDVYATYHRPLLAHLWSCPFCLGFWTSVAAYLAWLATPAWTLAVLTPFALSGVVGLVAKNLDA